TEQENEPDSGDLKTFLKQSLPDYMVPSAFVFLDAMPLNANGKLERKALPKPEYEPQEYSNYIEPNNVIECELVRIWSGLLAIDKIGVNDNFFDLGGDSILSIQFVTQAQRAGFFFTPKQIFEHQTIKALAAVASQQQNLSAEQGMVTGNVPLSPIQHWFFEVNQINPHHWNQFVVLGFKRNFDRTLLKQALNLLLLHHDMLRVRHREEYGENLQYISNESDVEIEYESQLGLSFPQKQEHLSTAVLNRVNLKTGPILRAIILGHGEEKGRKLLLSIHHLAVDAVSWRLILQDFQSLYQKLENGETTSLAPKTCSFKSWSQALTEFAHSPQLQKQAEYWTSLQKNKPKGLSVDRPQGDNNEGSVETITIVLSKLETQQLLQEVPTAYRTQINDILLAALTRALCLFNESESILIDLESHGRHVFVDNLDVSRTVGWFSNVYPVNLQLTANSCDLMIKSVKEQLRQVADQGLSYGLLRYLSPDEKVKSCLNEQVQAQVLFNYLGRIDRYVATDSTDEFKVDFFAKSCAEENPRNYEIEVVASIQGGTLVIEWNYSQHRYLFQTIETLAQSFSSCLHKLIEHCLQPDAGGNSPSDFPLMALTQQELDQLPVNHKNIEDIYPLTPLQQGMLFHSLSESNHGLYINQLKCRLQGHINRKFFEQSWQQTIANHSALHTGFFWKEVTSPVQLVVKQCTFAIEYLDWRHIEPEEQLNKSRQYSENDRKLIIDLSSPPLMRLTLIHMGDEQFYFIWTHHHIVLDGWSSSLLFAEVFNRYALKLKGAPSFLPAAPPYKNYLEWIGEQDRDVQEDYWKSRLQNFIVPTRLGIEKPVDEEHLANTEYAELESILVEEETIHFKSFTKQHKVTLNTLLQSAWALVLSTYSNEQDVVFGVTVSGRSAEIKVVDEIVGLFINTLPLRIQSSQNDSIIDWLQQIQAQNLQMRQYEHTALSDVQKWSDIASKQSLFDSIVVFENYPLDQQALEQQSSFAIQDVTTIERTNYPLTVAVFPGLELTVKIIYDTQQFEEEDIKKLLNHFHQALNAISNDKNKWIHQLILLNEHENTQQVQRWNATQAYYPENICIHTLFETQAAKTPDATAVMFMGEFISYTELNKQANQLAHYLILKGAGTETRVGICMERSLNLVIGIMAILKSGACYVPIDPAYPVERINFVLNDAEIALLLSQTDLIESLSVAEGTKLISIDNIDSEYSQNDFHNPDTLVTADNCAYVIYTSGSTGKPKGVVVNHGNLVNSVWARTQYYQEPVSRYLLLSSFAFDSSVAGIFWTFIQGGCLCLVDENTSKDPWEIGTVIKQNKVTHLLGLPSLYSELLEHVSEQSLATLNTVIVAGEACTREVVAKHYQNVPNVKLYNEYGPTEGTVWSSVYAVTDDKQSGAVSIGSPIANMQIYILDRNLNPLPVGIAGELVIGGIGITRGYLNQFSLTAEKFIPDPFSSHHGNRLYRTGDLARYKSDGNIEFLGRIDHQVKIRGHRIELGEIESCLLEHPDIKEAVVLAQGELVQLVAYVVSDQKADLDLVGIKKYLLQQLPSYMLPVTFVIIDHMPLNANAKVNQQALQEVVEINHCTKKPVELPIDPVGLEIASIWAEVLQINEVGIHQDFFELGGHSLLAIQVTSRIQQVFNIEMSVDTLFYKPTISELSESIIQLQIEQQGELDILELLNELELLSDEEVSDNLLE
ncbi:MAG: amino acid adenylation domain-containing protein, partial [Methylomarinum sp.]|nr:amino acid adenylation domain-containing protein [Methylomarinum sp.]